MFYVVNTSEEGDGRLRYVDVQLFPGEDDDPLEFISEFRYPVHIGSMRATSTMHREEMLQDALAATVYLVEKIKVKWYQKSFFKWLIIIIVVIVIILAWQYEWLPSLYALATAAAGMAALGYMILYVVVAFALGFMISFAGGLIGGFWGRLFVVVGMMLAFSGQGQTSNPFSSWSRSYNAFSTAPGWGSAFQLINATTPFLNFGMEVYSRYTMHKLESQMRDFEKNAREKQEELRDAYDNLGGPSWVDPMDLVLVSRQNNFIESPESFFNRTLNANPGILGYDLIHNFVDIALTLPEDPESGNMVTNMFTDFANQRGAV
jgi:hypothetical protein